MTKLYNCGNCGGPVVTVTGPNRTHPYKFNILVPVPDDFPLETCQTCGEVWMTYDQASKLDEVLDPIYNTIKR